MERIYETEKYAGQANVDYDELQKLADELREEEIDDPAICISYARVSTPKQMGKLSLMTQHKANVEMIRDIYDQDIVFVTEVGSGKAEARNRLLHKAIKEAPMCSVVFIHDFSRLTRDVEEFVPTAQLIEQKRILLFVGVYKNEKYGFIRPNEIMEVVKISIEQLKALRKKQ